MAYQTLEVKHQVAYGNTSWRSGSYIILFFHIRRGASVLDRIYCVSASEHP